TWNAYNSFGGRSNYINADELPPTPTVNARYDLKRYRGTDFFTWGAESYAPLSFDRPEPFNHIDFDERINDPIEGRQACHLAPAEWRFLRRVPPPGGPPHFFPQTPPYDGPPPPSADPAPLPSPPPPSLTPPRAAPPQQQALHPS